MHTGIVSPIISTRTFDTNTVYLIVYCKFSPGPGISQHSLRKQEIHLGVEVDNKEIKLRDV